MSNEKQERLKQLIEDRENYLELQEFRRDELSEIEERLERQLEKLQDRHYENPVSHQTKKISEVERRIDLLGAARDWSEGNCVDPWQYYEDVGDLPPSVAEHFNVLSHTIAKSLFDSDDGKTYRQLGASIQRDGLVTRAYMLHLLNLIHGRLSQTGAFEWLGILMTIQALLLAAVLWRVW